MSYKIPFGRYRGKAIYEIPDSYLVWMHRIAKGDLKQVCVKEMVSRFCNQIYMDFSEFDDDIDYNGDYEFWKD